MTPNVATPLIPKNKFVAIDDDNTTPWKIFGEDSILGFKFDRPLKYYNICYLGFFHLVTVYLIFAYPWIQKWKLTVFMVFYGSAAGLGVTAGVHRCFTHRSYKATSVMKIILLICYAAAGHNKVFDWVRDHRVHHKYSETDADPHNAKRGFFFSHVGWLLMKKHPEVIKKGKTIDMSDITNDAIIMWYDRNFKYLQYFFCFIFPACITRYIFGETWYWSIFTQVFMRYIIGINGTWMVNSAAHLFGNKPYDNNINPRENAFVSFIAIGEGWHNYHHTFPWDYKASEYGKFNVTTFWLDLFSELGMAYDLKTPSEELVRKTVLKLGDGTHSEYSNFVTEDGKIEHIKNE